MEEVPCFFAGNSIFLPANGIFLTDKLSLWEGLLFSSLLWTTWKGFFQLNEYLLLWPGWVQNLPHSSRTQEARPSRREENLRNQDISFAGTLCLSVFSLPQQCGVMTFHQPLVQMSGAATKPRTNLWQHMARLQVVVPLVSWIWWDLLLPPVL